MSLRFFFFFNITVKFISALNIICIKYYFLRRRMLTEQCLAHPWLNQDEVDGLPGKRLNTERLKKFMIRRKWLVQYNFVPVFYLV